MAIDSKECVEKICEWMEEHHDTLPPQTGYTGNFYTSGKKPSGWKRRGKLSQKDGVTIRVFERGNGAEAITPTMKIVHLPDEYAVTYSTKTEFLKLEFMSLSNITKLGVKVSDSFGGYLNFEDNHFRSILDIQADEAHFKKFKL